LTTEENTFLGKSVRLRPEDDIQCFLPDCLFSADSWRKIEGHLEKVHHFKEGEFTTDYKLFDTPNLLQHQPTKPAQKVQRTSGLREREHLYIKEVVGHSLIWVLAKERQWIVALSFRCCLCLSKVDWEGGVGILTNIQRYTMTNDKIRPLFVIWLPRRCQRCGTWILYERCEWGEVSCSPWLLVACVCLWVLALFMFISGPSSSFGQVSSSFVGGRGWLLAVW